MPRFTGHTISIISYSVAQHSTFVASRVAQFTDDKQVILKALLHDASEIYTSDIPSPVKKLPGFYPLLRELEARIYDAMFKTFDISPVTEDEKLIIKAADMYAQKLEAHAFMVSRGKNWANLPEVSIVELQNFEEPITNIEAYHRFLKMFKELRQTK
jgi:5'-deoxynucleotidase YfbR-like HD superfamily hydrolase